MEPFGSHDFTQIFTRNLQFFELILTNVSNLSQLIYLRKKLTIKFVMCKNAKPNKTRKHGLVDDPKEKL